MLSFKAKLLGVVCVAFLGVGSLANAGSISIAGDTSDPGVADKFLFNVLDAGDGEGTVSLILNSTTAVLPIEIVALSPGGGTVSTTTSGFIGEVFTAGTYELAIGGLGVAGPYDYTLSGDVSPVPLPAAAWLFGSAVLGLSLVSRRRRQMRPEVSGPVLAGSLA
ncbi:MAG: hypothetical protein AAGI44_02385 [Pseudomonadota bacterium]